MEPPPQRLALRAAAWLLGLTATTILLTALLRDRLPKQFGADFVCWWTAANLLARGEDPYDTKLQKQFQYDLGWRKEVEGGNTYEFVAFYHAPWLGLMCVPLVPLDYDTARTVFVVVNVTALLLAGWLLRRGVRHLAPVVVTVVPLFFGYSLYVLAIGQVTALVLLILVAAWRLLEARWDRTAGALLALATVKPHLLVVPYAALVVWAVVRRRWGLPIGLALGVAAVFGVSALFVGDWPVRMLQSQRETPLPTDFVGPGLGSTWFLFLQVRGLLGAPLWAAYLSVAGAVFAWVLWTAAREDVLLDVLCVGCMATFFVSPYSQPYDFVLLLPPILRLADRPELIWSAAVLLVFLAGPYFHWQATVTEATDHYKCFVVPVILLLLWVGRSFLPRGEPAAANPSPG
jgi:hypothetical protein